MKKLSNYGGTMPYCPKCGEELPEDVRFCPNCGTRIKISSRIKPMGTGVKLSAMAAEVRHNELLGFAMMVLGFLIAFFATVARFTAGSSALPLFGLIIGFFMVLIGIPIFLYYSWKHYQIMKRIKEGRE
jgi:hypothetical protein